MPRTSGNLRGLELDLSSSFPTLSSPISSFHTQPPSHVTHHPLLSEPSLLLLLIVLGLCNNVQTSDADDHPRCLNNRPLIIFYPSYIFRSSYFVNMGTQALVDTAFPCSIFHHPCHLALSVQPPLKFFYRPFINLPTPHPRPRACLPSASRHSPSSSPHYHVQWLHTLVIRSIRRFLTASFPSLPSTPPFKYLQSSQTLYLLLDTIYIFLASSYRPRHRSIFICCRFLVAPSMVCLVPV